MPTNHDAGMMKQRARELRQRQTEAEGRVWARLRAHRIGVHFRRQYVIGGYIVDFCAPRKKLVIEIDGGQHAAQEEYDAERSAFLESRGYRVLRFWNNEVMKDIDRVIEEIYHAVNES